MWWFIELLLSPLDTFMTFTFRKTIFPLMKFFHTTTSSKPRTRHGQFVQIRACIDYDLWVYFLLDYKLDRPFSKEYKSDLVFKQRYKNGECGEHAQSDFPRHCAISWTNGLLQKIRSSYYLCIWHVCFQNLHFWYARDSKPDRLIAVWYE